MIFVDVEEVIPESHRRGNIAFATDTKSTLQ